MAEKKLKKETDSISLKNLKIAGETSTGVAAAKKAAKTSAQSQDTEKKSNPNESVYPVEEFAKNAKIFGTSPVIVAAAMGVAGKTFATLSEAEQIIENYKKQEVRI